MAKPNFQLQATRTGTKVMTGLVRGAFVTLATPRAIAGDANSVAKYGLVMLIDSADPQLRVLKEAAQEAAVNKWGSKMPKTMKSPFRDGNEKDYQGYKDMIFVATSATADNKPGVVDAQTPPREIHDMSQCYSGAWYRCVVNAYAFEKVGNIGVAFGLNHVQKVADDEAFSGRGSVDGVFTGLINPDAPDAFKADDKKVDADVASLFD